ncbi:MAG: hypothetical protein R3F35_04865 [Myxococcota bacterium]
MSDEAQREEEGTCAACGGVIGSTMERSFVFGPRAELCARCAIERGGAYRADRDVWDPPPELSGLHPEDA